jgi:hypothetical protein
MMVSVAELENYTGKKLENNTTLQIYIDSAFDIISDYLGYDPMIKFNMELIEGNGTNSIQLKHKPINFIYKIMDYETQEILFETTNMMTQDYIINDEFVEFKNIIIPSHKILCEYIAGFGFLDFNTNTIYCGDSSTLQWARNISCGFADSDFSLNSISGGNAIDIGVIDTTVPAILKQTILRIAALLLTEADNNIGITSKNLGDSGSRTFVNYTNFDKYLIPLSRFKLIKI